MILIPLSKAYVKEKDYNNKFGTSVHVPSHFTKRPPAKARERHIRKRFLDHSETSAQKAIRELKEKIANHELNSSKAEQFLSGLKEEHQDNSGLSHAQKKVHLKQEIKNQDTHAESLKRKVDLIKNRWEISKDQIASKQAKSQISRSDHTEGQKNTLKSIHTHFASGKSNLKPTGNVQSGKDHILVETKHKDTGKIKHIAIDKAGKVHDPKTIDFKPERKVVVKKLPVVRKERPQIKPKVDPQVSIKMALGMTEKEAIKAVEEEKKIRSKAPKIQTLSQKIKERDAINTDAEKGPVYVGTMTASGEFTKVAPGVVVGKKVEAEKTKSSSEAMKGRVKKSKLKIAPKKEEKNKFGEVTKKEINRLPSPEKKSFAQRRIDKQVESYKQKKADKEHFEAVNSSQNIRSKWDKAKENFISSDRTAKDIRDTISAGEDWLKDINKRISGNIIKEEIKTTEDVLRNLKIVLGSQKPQLSVIAKNKKVPSSKLSKSIKTPEQQKLLKAKRTRRKKRKNKR